MGARLGTKPAPMVGGDGAPPSSVATPGTLAASPGRVTAAQQWGDRGMDRGKGACNIKSLGTTDVISFQFQSVSQQLGREKHTEPENVIVKPLKRGIAINSYELDFKLLASLKLPLLK